MAGNPFPSAKHLSAFCGFQAKYFFLLILVLVIVLLPCSTCEKGRWSCTENTCAKTCEVIGLGHVKTFDQHEYDMQGLSCEYKLVEVSAADVGKKYGRNGRIYTVKLSKTFNSKTQGSITIRERKLPCGKKG